MKPSSFAAFSDELKTVAENAAKEKKAFDACLGKVEEYDLDMQLVSAECAFDGSKLLFFFTADERVDFRDLVKDLASMFHTRIELRQIGVRDKAKMVGGLGICGRPFCCATFLDDFQPVSIKMAKTQNLSLNPTKISGTCGRLMCCLKYEQEAYEDLLRTSPKPESFVDTPDGRGTVIEIDLLRQRVKVRMEKQPETVGTYKNEDIAVLRSGKAKKNDPPIPDDLAPISGSGVQKKKEPEEDFSVLLQPIRMRYSEETIAEEQMAEEAPTEAAAEPKQGRNNHRRRKNKPSAPKAETKAEAPKAPQPKAEPSAAEAKLRQRRNRRRRHRPAGGNKE